jgi:hypothetical protein
MDSRQLSQTSRNLYPGQFQLNTIQPTLLMNCSELLGSVCRRWNVLLLDILENREMYNEIPLMLNYKGLDEEHRLIPLTITQSAELAKGTLYEAWFDTLKLSPWYRDITLNHNTTGFKFRSEKAEAAWRYFGDLRKMNFTDWWMQTGGRIFAEKLPYQGIKEMRIDVVDNPNAQKPPMLVIQVPLNLSPYLLSKQFDQIVQVHRESGVYNRWDHATADVHQTRDSKIGFKTIEYWLSIYKFYSKMKKQSENYQLYQLAMDKKLDPANAIMKGDLEYEVQEKKMKLASTSSNFLKKARYLMANAVELDFPNATKPGWWSKIDDLPALQVYVDDDHE